MRLPSILAFAVWTLGAITQPRSPAADAPAAAPKPKLITLKADATLDRVLDDLQTQADVAFDRSRADVSRPVKVDLDKVPFWEALERVAKAADERIGFGELGRTIYILGGEGVAYRQVPLSIDGIFRTSAERVVAIKDLENDQSVCEVELSLHWEPHFSAFLVEAPGKTIIAVDNTGKQIGVAEQGGPGRLVAAGGGRKLTVRLADVPRSSRTITKLEGSLRVVGAERMLRFDYPKLVAGKEETKSEDGVTVKVEPAEDVKAGSDLWTFRIALDYPEGGPQLESYESAAWLADNAAYLVSTDNKRRLDMNGGSEIVTQNERHAVVKYRWVPQGDEKDLGKPADWKLVVRTPSRLVEVPVKFKLENISLP